MSESIRAVNDRSPIKFTEFKKPNGFYKATVVDVLAKSSKAGNPMPVYVFRLAGHNQAVYPLWCPLSPVGTRDHDRDLAKANQPRLAAGLKAMSRVQFLDEFDADEMRGRRLVVELRGEYWSRIKGWRSVIENVYNPDSFHPVGFLVVPKEDRDEELELEL